MAAYRNIPLQSELSFYLEYYYHLKALKRIGFRYDIGEHDPYTLDILTMIEVKMAKLEAQDLERQAKK